MVFSKSFGYALRGILYIAAHSDGNGRVQIEVMAKALKVPRHFLGKIMKRVAEEGIIDSTKGPYGGFSLNNKTLSVPLIKIIMLTDGMDQFNNCILRLKKCNPNKPCPLHDKIEKNRKEFTQIFAGNTVADLLKNKPKNFIDSMVAA